MLESAAPVSNRHRRSVRFVALEAWAAEELSLPMHPDLLSEEIESVVEAVHAALPASLPAPESVLC
jgi:dTDP-4-amino-4,6-dideoxygalactose transaminase